MSRFDGKTIVITGASRGIGAALAKRFARGGGAVVVSANETARSADDRAGTIKVYVGEGEFTEDPFPMDGGIAVTKVARLRPLLGFIARNGFEHHVAMVRGHHAEAVYEAVARYLQWPIYHHEHDSTGVSSQSGNLRNSFARL